MMRQSTLIKDLPQSHIDALTQNTEASGVNRFVTLKDIGGLKDPTPHPGSVKGQTDLDSKVLTFKAETSARESRTEFGDSGVNLRREHPYNFILYGESPFGNSLYEGMLLWGSTVDLFPRIDSHSVKYELEVLEQTSSLTFVVTCSVECSWKLWLIQI